MKPLLILALCLAACGCRSYRLITPEVIVSEKPRITNAAIYEKGGKHYVRKLDGTYSEVLK